MVIIVGAGPAGLATSACLNRLSIPNIVLEREDCYASLWKKRSYDRLKLHLAKQFCHLPYMDSPPNAPTYDAEKWQIVVKNMATTDNVIETEVYTSRFLVAASGENSQGTIPDIDGLDSYGGECIHSNQYENGRKFRGKDVLVVGCGNSGMEIAYDLWNSGANTSIVVLNPVHVLTKEMVKMAMIMLQYLPRKAVDKITVAISKLEYGKLSKFRNMETSGRSPVNDVGTISKIKSEEIKVLPGMKSIRDKDIVFTNGIFATGYKSTVRNWRKGSYESFNEKGMPRKSFPYHWKGRNGIYNVGFSRRGLQGISSDAQNIANDIYSNTTVALGFNN
ncbi:hypothetical protein GOBAR_DD07193 [Gossypium barbadense]|nr:hypothetical protein GOBAR_DD07193 [Gossypium barbadense]